MIEYIEKDATNMACMDIPSSESWSHPLILIKTSAFSMDHGIYSGRLPESEEFDDLIYEHGYKTVYEVCFSVVPIPEPGTHYELSNEQIEKINEVLNGWMSL